VRAVLRRRQGQSPRMSLYQGSHLVADFEGVAVAVDGEPGTLVISEQARVDGEIRVSHIVVNGTVNGPVIADDYLELQVHSRVTGDVTYKTLEMHVGAVIEGRLNHAEPGSASVVELKRVASE
jgi:cytoskeletal protein CcmA (bactofilin family)